jgi:hypothetical protein
MTEWLSLLYVGPHQVLPVLIALVLWVALAGLGYLVTPRGRIVEANPFIGWAVVSTVFTLVGVVVERPFFLLSILAGLGALAGIALSLKRREPLFVPGFWRVLVLALPLLLITGAMEPSQWDEFSHWLPAPKYLLAYDGFPTAERPYAGPHMLSAYPYAWPFLIYLSARIAGRFLDNVGGILNLVMLLTFAAFAVRTAFAVAGRPRGPAIRWPLAAGVVLAATLFNPTLVQKVVLTSYSDVACSAVMGVALLIGYELLAAMRAQRSMTSLAWSLAFVLALLVNVRQPNAVVVAGIVLAAGLAAWRDDDVSVFKLIRLLVPVLVPALVVYVGWRWYVGRELAQIPGAEAALLPFESWHIAAIPKILEAMVIVALKKFAFFGPMLVACGFALRALFKGVRTDFDRIAVLTAIVFLVYNAFLLFTYVAHFPLHSAVTVVSYWRYNMDIGAASIIFIGAGALTLWSRHRSFDAYPKWAAPAAIILILALPIAVADKIRFDLEPPKPHFTRVAKDIAGLGLQSTPYLLDPHGTGEASVITRVYMNTEGAPWLGAFHDTSPKSIAEFVAAIAPGRFLLIHSIAPGVVEAVGRALDPRCSYLFKREGDGWTLVRDWPKPANHPW